MLLRPSLHLPLAPCEKFVYDFSHGFLGGDRIGGYTGYGVCVYIIYEYRVIFVRTLGGLIGTNLKVPARPWCSRCGVDCAL